ncbi:MAG: hypothetical protein HQ582_09005 [Planctomycetes bacterium]|nr:hypothetical protein [Planctomycetota bacterium]
MPQGLASRDGRLYLSAHAHDTKSAVFELDDQQKEFVKLFDLPADATHTSGIDFHAKEKDRLFVVDYNSDRVYLVDFAESKRVGKAVVLAAIDSQLRGTSACCLVDLPGEEERLMVTDFGTSGRNVFFTFDLKQNRMKLDSERSYSNYGWSQGATQHGGYVYETGNSLLSSYIVQHRLEDALSNGRITPVRKRSGPTRMIEGIVFLQDTVYVADEGTNLLYHSGWPSASSK